MLEQIMRAVNNWFECDYASGTFVCSNGSIVVPEGFLEDGQYFRVCGSKFNDGLHQWPAEGFRAETFHGSVVALAVPRAFEELATEIEEWNSANKATAESPFSSESFGGYSYSKAEVGSTWQAAFRSRLNQWRKI